MGKFNKKSRAMSGTLLLASFGAFTPSMSGVVYGGDPGTGGGGGNGVCVGTCDALPPYFWRVASTDGSKTAWQKFAGDNIDSWGNAGLSRLEIEGYTFPRLTAYGMSNKELLKTCQDSKMIWWVSASNPYFQDKANGWVWNYGGQSYPKINSSGSTIDNAKTVANSTMNPALLKAAKGWASTMGVGKYTIICSGQTSPEGFNQEVPPKPSPKKKVWDETRTIDKGGSEQKWTRPYTYNTMVTRQISKDGKDPIGKNNLHDQATFQKTSFGALWDDMQKNPSKYSKYTPAQIKQLVDKAEAADKKANHSVLNLDQGNKDGLAEGGVLNVSQLTKNATIKASQSITDNQKRTCTTISDWVYNSATSKWVPAPDKTTCTGWQNTSSSSSLATDTSIESTLRQTAFWQILAVHCNKEQFEALAKNAAGSRIVKTGDASNAISAVIYSKKYVTQPGALDFGDANNGNKALAESAKLGFYDKECPFECTASPSAPGASSQNGAASNIGSNKPNGSGSTVGRYGAVSGNNNESDFTFFRDNVQHLITTDVWYPVSNGIVKYNGQEPLSTTINRWAEGTPSLDGTDGGKFTMSTKDGKELFTGDSSAATQKNFSVDNFSNSTSTQLSGLVRAFNVQATWASEKNKPQTLNFKWEYAPTVNTTAMVNGVGFNANDDVIGTESTLSAPIQGKCYAVFGGGKTVDTMNLFAKNTGSGTKNNLDGSLIGENKDPNLYINFVRSTTE